MLTDLFQRFAVVALEKAAELGIGG